MVTSNAKGSITIVDLNDGKTLNFVLSNSGSNTQFYNSDTYAYTPNYTTSSITITPKLYVSGESTDQMAHVTSVTWTINGAAATAYGTIAASSPYALTINKNMTSVTSLQIVCNGTYTDPDTGATTPVTASTTINRIDTAGSNITADITYPNGTTFYKSEISSLKLTCTMYRGGVADSTNVTYQWYQKSASGTWTRLTSTNAGTMTGYTTKTLTIYPADVLNFEQFKCICTDTDTSSPTYQAGNRTCEAVSQVIVDLTDTYTIEIDAPAGNVLSSGATSCTLTANVKQGVEYVADSFYTNATFTWSKADKTGAADTTWGTNGTKTGRSITVNRSEISVKATFTVVLSL